MNSSARLGAIVMKEFRQLRRDRLTFGMIIGIPLIQLLLFGYAINTDVRHLQAAVVDLAGTGLSREFVADVAASQVVDIATEVASVGEIEELLRIGDVSVGIVIPQDFDRRVARPEGRLPAQLLVDGGDPTIVSVSSRLREIPLGFATGASAPRLPSFEVRNYYNPERRSAVNVVPGLIGVILTMTMLVFTAVAVVRERERGNLEFLINTPVRPVELMVGKVVPYVGIGLIQVTIIQALGFYLFRVPVAGSILDLYLASLLFITANLALGLLISTRVQTQFQAMQASFFLLLPSILLSGFMFPFDGMPKAAQYIAQVLPLTHFVELARGIMLRGASIGELGREVLALAVFTLVTMSLSVARFHKRLD